MEQKSIKVNYILNTTRILLSMLFPLITFPYASRVLQPEGIGIVTFANSVIAYFIMISSIGIPTYGVRECAKVRDDKTKLSKIAHELLIINFVSALISYILLIFAIIFSNKLYSQKEILILTSTGIIFTTIGMEWLYQAVEDYLYITVRSFIFQLISMVLLFLTVKSKNDYFIYAALGVISSVGSNIANFIHSKKYIYFKYLGQYSYKKHLKPIFTLFGMSIAVSVYTNLDSVMLGFMSGERSVGLYSAALKINRMIITFVTSLSSVMLPRSSYYLKKGMLDEFNILINRSLNFILLLSLPIISGLLFLSDDIMMIFCGRDYIQAGTTMKILTFIILLIGLSNLIGIQILIPKGKEKLTLYSVIVGLLINVPLNLILIPKYHQNGTALATLIAELGVTLTQIIFTWGYIKKFIFTKNKLKYIISTIAMTLLLIILTNIHFNYIIIKIILAVGISCVTYFTILLLMKEELVTNIFLSIKRRILHAF